jgi:hypothetical protein
MRVHTGVREKGAVGMAAHEAADPRYAHRHVRGAVDTPADVMENTPMLPLLRRAMFRWRMRPRQVVGDTTYGTADNIRELEESGVRAYVPLPDWEQRTPSFGASLFTYDAERDRYVCPQGEVLRRQKASYSEEKVIYRADAAVCNACLVRGDCTPSDHGRQIARPFDADYLDRVRGYHETEDYKRAMRKCKVWIEPGALWAASGRPNSGMGCASSGCGD